LGLDKRRIAQLAVGGSLALSSDVVQKDVRERSYLR